MTEQTHAVTSEDEVELARRYQAEVRPMPEALRAQIQDAVRREQALQGMRRSNAPAREPAPRRRLMRFFAAAAGVVVTVGAALLGAVHHLAPLKKMAPATDDLLRTRSLDYEAMQRELKAPVGSGLAGGAVPAMAQPEASDPCAPQPQEPSATPPGLSAEQATGTGDPACGELERAQREAREAASESK